MANMSADKCFYPTDIATEEVRKMYNNGVLGKADGGSLKDLGVMVKSTFDKLSPSEKEVYVRKERKRGMKNYYARRYYATTKYVFKRKKTENVNAFITRVGTFLDGAGGLAEYNNSIKFVEKNRSGKEIPVFYATITPPKVNKGIEEIEVYVVSLVCKKDDKVVGSFDYDSVSILENQAVRFGCDEMHFLKFMISRNKLCNPATVLQELSHMYVGE